MKIAITILFAQPHSQSPLPVFFLLFVCFKGGKEACKIKLGIETGNKPGYAIH